jgi:tricorn protease-like protein
MKTGFLLIGALVLALHPSFAAEAGAPQSKIAFERGSNVWIANIDGTKERKLIKGDDSRIAPDGTKVAFTMTPTGSKDVECYIAVVDVEAGATKIFDIASGKATRLTPKKSYASDSCWLSDSEILVVDAQKDAKVSSIYRVSISDGASRLVIKNAFNPSVSGGL